MEVHGSIPRTGRLLGKIPLDVTIVSNFFNRLKQTHALIHGNEAVDTIQVWKNIKIGGSYFS